MQPINLAAKLAAFTETYSPKIVGAFNGHDLMVVKVLGDFVWHHQPDTDDFFMVLQGELFIDLPGETICVKPGEVFVVPTGMQHRPRADVETHLLLIEPAGTPNTGDPATAAVKTAL